MGQIETEPGLRMKRNLNKSKLPRWFSKQPWRHLRLRQKLTLGVWLSIIPFSVAGSSLALWNAHRMAIYQWQRLAIKHVDLITELGTSRENAMLNYLKSEAKVQELIDLDPLSASQELEKSKRRWPSYDFAVFDARGKTIATSFSQKREGFNTEQMSISNAKWFRQTMKGETNSWLEKLDKSETSFVISATPIRRINAKENTQPIAILANQIKLSSYDRDTGLDLISLSTSSSQAVTSKLLDPGQADPEGIAVMIIQKPGTIHFIGQKNMSETDRTSMLDPAKAKRSRWRAVIKKALQPGAEKETKTLAINGKEYLLTIKRITPSTSIALIIDQETALENVNTLFGWFWVISLIALCMSSVVIYRICSALSKPVDQAGEALAAISQGKFETKLPTNASDLGRLFSYINQASDQLKAYVAASSKQAVMEAQLSEARRIQDDFLIKDLPWRPEISIAASFTPAYEIGADWYDAIEIGHTIYFVVADVCDKGIPSALYMSVFRSLLRQNIINENKNSDDQAEVLCKALSAVNNYMAMTHGDTAMFATIFVGAYTITSRCMSYIVAGHEAPLLLHDRHLEELKLGGPAVGLFKDAIYTPHQCNIETGSLVLAYSDGLLDSRNAKGTALGSEKIQTILLEQSSYQWSTRELMERLKHEELNHRGETEQFDDLTLMVIKIEATNSTVNTELVL